MDFTIPDEYKMMQQMARRFMEDEIYPLEKEIDETDRVPMDEWRRLVAQAVELGLWAPFVPEKWGGGGIQSTICNVMLSEEFGKGPLVFALFFLNGSLSDLDSASDYLKEQYLLPHIRGEKFFAGAFTEPTTGGSDQSAMLTTAKKDGDNWVINGSKTFISGADFADFFMLAARTALDKPRGGVTQFFVDKDQPGLKIGREQKTLGNRGLTQYEIYFDDCIVPDANRAGAPGGGMAGWMRMIVVPRLRVAAWGVGGAQRCFELGINWAKERVTFGKPLSYRQAIQWMVVDSWAEILSTRLFLHNTAWRLDQGEDVLAEAGMCKVMGSELGQRVSDRVIQIYGGHGYTNDFPMERIWRDQRGCRIYEGANEILHYLAARKLLDVPSMINQ
ncbi:MAG: acyl-CoA dehydrogenase family protein [Chloroflexota bacterium]|nr:acyl-CoA dehydrogenase family protein [Chloroflexota bacterium]